MTEVPHRMMFGQPDRSNFTYDDYWYEYGSNALYSMYWDKLLRPAMSREEFNRLYNYEYIPNDTNKTSNP